MKRKNKTNIVRKKTLFPSCEQTIKACKHEISKSNIKKQMNLRPYSQFLMVKCAILG